MAEVQQTIQQVKLQPYQETMQKDIYASLKNLMGSPMPVPQYSQYIAGLDPYQIQAQELAAQGIGAYQPMLDQSGLYTGLAGDYAMRAAEQAEGAAGSFDPTMINQFMNPYEQDVIDPTMRRMREQQALDEQRSRAAAVSSGAFGSAGARLAQAQSAKNAEQLRAETLANLRYQGYQQAGAMAQAAFEDAQKRKLGIAQLTGQAGQQLGQTGAQFGDLAKQGQAMSLEDINTLMKMGQINQDQAQAMYSAQLKEQLELAMEPYKRVGFAADIFSGQPTSSTTFQQQNVPSGSSSSEKLGLGITALGIASGLGGYSPFGS